MIRAMRDYSYTQRPLAKGDEMFSIGGFFGSIAGAAVTYYMFGSVAVSLVGFIAGMAMSFILEALFS